MSYLPFFTTNYITNNIGSISATTVSGQQLSFPLFYIYKSPPQVSLTWDQTSFSNTETNKGVYIDPTQIYFVNDLTNNNISISDYSKIFSYVYNDDKHITFSSVNINYDFLFQDLDETSITIHIPKNSFYKLVKNNGIGWTKHYLENDHFFKSYLSRPLNIIDNTTVDLKSKTITIIFNKNIQISNKENISILYSNKHLFTPNITINNKTLVVDISYFNKYAHGNFVLLLKKDVIESVSIIKTFNLEEDYKFDFFIPKFQCAIVCPKPATKTNLNGYPGGIPILNNDFGSHNTKAMKNSKQIINSTATKNRNSSYINTSSKRNVCVRRISNF